MNDDALFTRAVHAGADADEPHGAVAPPIHQSAVYAFEDAAGAADVHEGRAPGFFYGREGTPTHRALGAGPVGLAAAAHLARRGLPFRVLEAGIGPGTHVAGWSHVRMFSPWRYNVDPVAGELLTDAGWSPPPGDLLPTVRAAGRPPVEVDVVVAATGYRPDRSLAAELRLDLDPATESSAALGPLIDPNVHSCGTVPPHGVDELSHPDTGYYAVGIKSYGRAPTFLLLTGYEQVRSIVAALAGDEAAAREVRLVLPETGVCSSPPREVHS